MGRGGRRTSDCWRLAGRSAYGVGCADLIDWIVSKVRLSKSHDGGMMVNIRFASTICGGLESSATGLGRATGLRRAVGRGAQPSFATPRAC